MPDTPEDKFAHLVGQTFKAKVSILLLLMVALFIVWSTLKSGQQKLGQVDQAFCLQLVREPYYAQGAWEFLCDSPRSASQWIYSTRLRLWEKPWPDPQKDLAASNQFILEFSKHIREFEDYDRKSRDAYQMELSLPYTKEPVPLDGALLSDVWPFCALLVLSTAIVLGFKQKCYEIHLSSLLAKTEHKERRAKDFALAQFLAGDLRESNLDDVKIYVYKRPFVLSPNTLISGALFTVVLIQSLSLLTNYSPRFSERGEEVFSGYYTWLYLFSVLMLLLLAKTRRTWRATVSEALGGEVWSAYTLAFQRFWQNWFTASWQKAYIIWFAILGLAGFFFRWENDVRGYTVLWRPAALIPYDAKDARFAQLEFAFLSLFFLVCIMSVVTAGTGRNLWRRLVYRGRNVFASIVLVVVGEWIFFVWLSGYGMFMNFYVRPLLTPSFASQAVGNEESIELDDDIGSRGSRLCLISSFSLALLCIGSKKMDKITPPKRD